jgi:hypothetical protein
MLAFALEEYLPVEIERMTCEFLRAANGDFIGVAVETARVRPLLEALAARNIGVECATLDVLAPAMPPDGSRLVWCDDGHAAILSTKDNRLDDLRIIRLAAGLSDDEWCRRLTAHLDDDAGSRTDPLTAIAGCADEARLAALATSLSASLADQSADGRSATTARVDFNLARDGLMPAAQRADLLGLWRRASAALLVALVLLSAGLGIQRARLQQQLGGITAWERDVYARLFPGQPAPTGVALRLASERRRLEGLTLADDSGQLERVDALETLRAVVAALPTDLRLDLQEIRIEGADLMIRGRTRDHQQAERLAAAIDAVDDVHCAAPRTDRHRAGGVQFFMHAQRAEGPRAGGEGKP